MGREFQISKTTKFGDLLYNSAKALNTAELNLIIMGFPCGSAGKESTCKVGRPGFDIWVGKIPWRKNWQPTPVFLPRESSWTGEAGRLQPMGSQESDTT